MTDDVSTILFLARWVPDWALAEAFHTNPAKIYRLINSFGVLEMAKKEGIGLFTFFRFLVYLSC